jgi:allene oxide cyclase
MRRTIMTLIAVAGLGTLALAGGSIASSSPSSLTKVHVIEHAVTDTVIDVGASGDSTGDLLTFHNRLYDAADATVVGRDQGECVRISPAKGTWECRWTSFLPGGQITVEGPFFDTHNSTLSITGGTGRYATAEGDMLLLSRNGGAEYDFVFRVA